LQQPQSSLSVSQIIAKGRQQKKNNYRQSLIFSSVLQKGEKKNILLSYSDCCPASPAKVEKYLSRVLLSGTTMFLGFYCTTQKYISE